MTNRLDELGPAVVSAAGFAGSVPARLALLLGVGLTQLAIVGLFYRIDVAGILSTFAGGQACSTPDSFPVLCGRVANLFEIAGLAGLFAAVYVGIDSQRRRALLALFSDHDRPSSWLVLNAVGFIALITPYVMIASGFQQGFAGSTGFWIWLAGGLLAIGGLAGWIAPFAGWSNAIRSRASLVFFGTAATIALALEFQRFGWADAGIQQVTFATVVAVLELLGQAVQSDAARQWIDVEGFDVIVAQSCSGIAGVVLSMGVVSLYIAMGRDRLNLGRALLLIPLAAGLSWVLNALRVALLLMIGAHVSPELALEGFHSYAGWLSFSVMSVLLLACAESCPWFFKPETRTASDTLPLSRDPVAAEIVPFVVLATTSLAIGALFSEPEQGYPIRFLALLTALIYFLPVLKTYLAGLFRPAAFAWLMGAGIAVVWLAIKAGGDATSLADIVGPASPMLAAGWIVVRVAGTTLLIPIVEELFFRGYLLRTLTFDIPYGKTVSVIVTSAAFAALHADILLAFGAGIGLALVALRRGRVVDAIVAHMVANAIIAAWALHQDNWSVI